MKCSDCKDLIQRRLDGETSAAPALDEHLRDCPSCRDWQRAALLLIDAVRDRPRPTASRDLGSRITRAVLQDRRSRTFRLRTYVAVGTALAASVLIAAAAHWHWSTPAGQPLIVKGDQESPQKQDFVKEATPPASLQESVAEVGEAMTSLTERIAGETRDHAEIIWQVARPIDLSSVAQLSPTEEMAEPLTPAAEPLRNAGRGVSQGIETVAQSAQRAMNFFLREVGAAEKSTN